MDFLPVGRKNAKGGCTQKLGTLGPALPRKVAGSSVECGSREMRLSTDTDIDPVEKLLH